MLIVESPALHIFKIQNALAFFSQIHAPAEKLLSQMWMFRLVYFTFPTPLESVVGVLHIFICFQKWFKTECIIMSSFYV